MRLGIRRKLIGTLMLVGLFPLAMSLVVILVGGAAMQLTRIRTSYEETAAGAADRVADTLLHDELEKLTLLAHLPHVVEFVRAQNKAHLARNPAAPALPADTAPARGPRAAQLDQRWSQLKDTDAPLSAILTNPVANWLRLMTQVNGHLRQIVVTNAYGELIAADSRTGDYFQADESWWQAAFNNGKGQIYLSSVVTNPADSQKVIILALPIYDDAPTTTSPGHPRIIGIIEDKLPVSWILAPLQERPALLGCVAQLIDLDQGKPVYATDPTDADRAANFYFAHRDEDHIPITTLLSHNIIIGSERIPLLTKLGAMHEQAQLPKWVVLVSKPSEEAMTPVYHLALTVAAVGIALILVLFIVGVAISNREIILPILRLREATAAVGRGELNVRLLSTDPHGPAGQERDPTFRRDELGDLARDFDEMTRQLQKNLNQLARSNEAKRRFMELAGHELRTPVTYLLGVCQLAQRQIQQLSEAATDGLPENEQSIALAGKNAAAVQGALTKIAAKTQRLSRIIDNLLKLVTNDQFTTRMNKAPVDIRALLLQVTSDLRPFIVERKQQLTVDVAENLPSIEADRDKLEDALTNLVSNAIRFSPDGGSVRVAAHELQSAAGNMLEILVEDSGPGIPPQDLANLFEPFYTGADILHHHSGTFEFGSKGIGLGLAIVRRFIELHGGIVRAHTIAPPDNPTAIAGTQFQILLPLLHDSAGSAAGLPAIKE